MFFSQCFKKQLAAITYFPLRRTDLSKYGPQHKPPGWDGLAPSQKGSISLGWKQSRGFSIYPKSPLG